MTTMLHTLALTNAAWREAVRLRHPEADVDHHLLGLIAAGGPAAALLGQHGVTLTAARVATLAQRRDGLAPLGLDASGVPEPEPLPIADLHQDAGGHAPTSHRVGAVLDALPRSWSELDLLVELATERSGTGGAVLDRCGVDVDRLVAQARGTQAGTGTDLRRRPPIADLAPVAPATARTAMGMTHYVSAPPDVVRAAAATAEHALTWLNIGDRGSVGDDRTLRVDVSRHGRSATHVLTRVADGSAGDGLRVAWQESMSVPGSRWDGAVGGYHDLRLREAPGGTLVDYVRGMRTFGRFARPALLLARLASHAAIPRTLQNLAFVAADLQRS